MNIIDCHLAHAKFVNADVLIDFLLWAIKLQTSDNHPNSIYNRLPIKMQAFYDIMCNRLMPHLNLQAEFAKLDITNVDNPYFFTPRHGQAVVAIHDIVELIAAKDNKLRDTFVCTNATFSVFIALCDTVDKDHALQSMLDRTTMPMLDWWKNNHSETYAAMLLEIDL